MSYMIKSPICCIQAPLEVYRRPRTLRRALSCPVPVLNRSHCSPNAEHQVILTVVSASIVEPSASITQWNPFVVVVVNGKVVGQTPPVLGTFDPVYSNRRQRFNIVCSAGNACAVQLVLFNAASGEGPVLTCLVLINTVS